MLIAYCRQKRRSHYKTDDGSHARCWRCDIEVDGPSRDMSAHCIRAIVVAASLVAAPGCDVLTARQERTELKDISSLYYSAQHEAVVQRVRAFTSRHPVTIENVQVLMFKAESEYQLGRPEAAIQDYQSALDIIEKVANNVNQRQYASAYFRLGVLLQTRSTNR